MRRLPSEKSGRFIPQTRTPYKITWRTWNERRVSYCKNETELWHDFYHLICNAFNNCQAYIDDKLVKEDPEHGWNTNCPICQEARDFIAKERK